MRVTKRGDGLHASGQCRPERLWPGLSESLSVARNKLVLVLLPLTVALALLAPIGVNGETPQSSAETLGSAQSGADAQSIASGLTVRTWNIRGKDLGIEGADKLVDDIIANQVDVVGLQEAFGRQVGYIRWQLALKTGDTSWGIRFDCSEHLSLKYVNVSCSNPSRSVLSACETLSGPPLAIHPPGVIPTPLVRFPNYFMCEMALDGWTSMSQGNAIISRFAMTEGASREITPRQWIKVEYVEACTQLIFGRRWCQSVPRRVEGPVYRERRVAQAVIIATPMGLIRFFNGHFDGSYWPCGSPPTDYPQSPWDRDEECAHTKPSEFDAMSAFIESFHSDLPLVLTGDFNDVALHPTHSENPNESKLFKALTTELNLQESWITLNPLASDPVACPSDRKDRSATYGKLCGYTGSSYPGDWLVDRVDYIMFTGLRLTRAVIPCRDEASSTCSRSGGLQPYAVTDHYPVTATFGNGFEVATNSLNGTVGEPFSATLVTNPPTIPGSATWSILTGTLPAGLALDLSTGAISGVASTVGTSTVTVQATSNGHTTSPKDVVISISPPQPAGVWPQWIATQRDDMAYDIAIDGRDIIYVAGSAGPLIDSAPHGGGFIASYEPNGHSRWTRQIAGTQEFRKLGFDSLGNVYAIGVTNESVVEGSDSASPPFSVILSSFDSEGTLRWNAIFALGSYENGIYADKITDFNVDQSGNTYFVVGDFRLNEFYVGSFNSSGVRRWITNSQSAVYQASILADGSSSVYVLHGSVLTRYAAADGSTLSTVEVPLIADLLGRGAFAWYDTPWLAAKDSSGNLYVSGSASKRVAEAPDPFDADTGFRPLIASISTLGTTRWVRQPPFDRFSDVAGFGSYGGDLTLDATGNLYVTSAMLFKTVVASFTSTGADRWIRELPAEWDLGHASGAPPIRLPWAAVASDAAGNLYLAADVGCGNWTDPYTGYVDWRFDAVILPFGVHEESPSATCPP